jgi:hypothetical protein
MGTLPRLVALLVAAAGTPTFAQDEPAPPAPAPANPAVDEARALFERLVAASGRTGRDPLTAFHLRAEVLLRNGVQSNETHIDYRWMAPDCVRFLLPSRNETGRSGRRKADYWLRADDGVIVLSGREYAEDRHKVDQMAALATNYVALTDPGRLDLRTLERLDVAPPNLPGKFRRQARELEWLALVSPDFALVQRSEEAPAAELYRVALGLGPDALPQLALIQPEPGDGGPPWPGDALLVAFQNYQDQSGFRVPFTLLVHAPDPDRPTRFLSAPVQEVWVTEADLRPSYTVDDFRP